MNDVDIVCMMEQNHPTFFISLLAISKIGAVPSLINTNLSDAPLLHCIKIASTKLFLFDPVFAKQVETIADKCKELNVELVTYGEMNETQEHPGFPFAAPLNPSELAKCSDKDTSEKPLRGVQPSDPAYLIYTR